MRKDVLSLTTASNKANNPKSYSLNVPKRHQEFQKPEKYEED